MSNQSYHHEDLRSELIRKGLLILDKEGYEGFSLRKVTKACNVSEAAPYRHFKNKDELITAIMIEAMQSFDQSLEQAALKHPNDPKKQLKEIGIAYIRFFSKNPEYLRLIFLSDVFKKMNVTKSEDYEDIGSSQNYLNRRQSFAIFYNAVKNYVADFPDESIGENELTLYYWGLVHGISILISKEKIPYQGDYLELAERIIWNDKFF